MIIKRNIGILENYTRCPVSLCSFCQKIFSLDLSGLMINLFWYRFVCNHGHAHKVILKRIDQTDSLINVKKTWPQNSAFLWNLRARLPWLAAFRKISLMTSSHAAISLMLLIPACRSKENARNILPAVRFIMKKHPPLPWVKTSSFIIALAAMPKAMSLGF